jgi:zinc/manganese transport system ATP-binding protein
LWSDLDLEMERGQLVAVLGANGAGKTTLLRVLLGLHPLLRGTARILGEPPRRGNPHVGYVPQQRAFDPSLTLRGVDLVQLGLDGHRWGIGLGSRASRGRVGAALEVVGAADYAWAPMGTLSGGERQRLRVAQALVSAPDIVLADEPLLSLDPSSQHDVVVAFDARRRNSNALVVVVTHDINPLRDYVDRVLYLAGGRWAAGSPDEVLTAETLSALYGMPVEVADVGGRVVIAGAFDPSTEHADDPHHVHEVESQHLYRG